MAERVYIFDTTLRDGEQSPGASMTQAEKIDLAKQLESLGVDIIEAGFPAASEGDFEAVRLIARQVKGVSVAGLARAVVSDIDRAYEAVKEAANPRIHTFISTSDLHMKHKLRKSPQEVADMAEAAVRHAVSLTKNVEFSAEDASRSDWEFLAHVAERAIAAGATTINIPDTVGYAQPFEFAELIRYLLAKVPSAGKAIFSVHCHNDLGLGAANTLAALHAGARQAEVTLCGIGERAGNAALEEVVMALHTRGSLYNLETGVKPEHIFRSCRRLSKVIGLQIPKYKAIVGGNAFAHEAGIHQDGMLKNRLTYEIMTPESIGRSSADSEIVLGKHSGRHALVTKIEALGYTLDDSQTTAVFEAVKTLADKKKHVSVEDLEALVLEELYRGREDTFELRRLSVMCGNMDLPPTAAVVLRVKGEPEDRKLADFGIGPVDATFNVINKITGRKPQLKLFNINAISGGADAQGEVTVILEEDGLRAVGASLDEDIIGACAKAYLKALNRLEFRKGHK
jgi:2-isopropylmalate synthase